MLRSCIIVPTEIAMRNAAQRWTRIVPTFAAVSAVIALLVTSEAAAQVYPSKLIKIICPIPSGSVVDVTLRLVTPGLSARLGVPVIVENRPGGGGTIGTKEFARAASDGHTLLFSGLFNVFTFKILNYDPVKDFVPIALAATHYWILVVPPTLPARSLKELIDHAKANPGKLNWGFGQGSSPHMFGELFMAETGIDVARVPYKSGTLAVPDVLGGRIDMNFGTISNLLPLIREGKLRPLAITSEVRSMDLPEVPTMAELGFPQLTRRGWVERTTDRRRTAGQCHRSSLKFANAARKYWRFRLHWRRLRRLDAGDRLPRYSDRATDDGSNNGRGHQMTAAKPQHLSS
jgi:tripartite-type tricarboxylate transporter receptor subunit TctC